MQPQDVIVLTLVLVAGAYLARSAWRTMVPKQQGSCPGCGTGCKAPSGQDAAVDVVQLQHRPPADQIYSLDR